MAALGALFTAGTLGALVLSLTPSGVFGFHETLDAELVGATLVVESVGTLTLTLLAPLALGPRLRLSRRSRRRAR